MRRGFANRFGLGFLVFLAGAPAFGETFTDPGTGFAVTVPDGFVFRPPRKDANHEVLVEITSRSGHSPVAGRSEALCAAGFRRFPAGSVASQAELNALPARKRMVSETREVLATQGLRTESVDSIPGSDFAGFEVISTPTAGPDHRNVRIYMAVMDRVIGRTDLVCATTKHALPDAMPIFRAIRDGIRPPTR